MSPCFCQSKEERILELETEKAILHLRLAEVRSKSILSYSMIYLFDYKAYYILVYEYSNVMSFYMVASYYKPGLFHPILQLSCVNEFSVRNI